MQECHISSFREFLAVVSQPSRVGHETIFRGVRDVQHHLIPSVGRNYTDNERLTEIEREMLTLFKAYAVAHISGQPDDDWHWLALAQHHRMPTRFLDWTRNPLVALFFAVETLSQSDAAVYVWDEVKVFSQTPSDPFTSEVSEVLVYIAPHFSPRIPAQSGVLTFHAHPTMAHDSDQITKVIVPSSTKNDFKHILAHYGVHRASLFPDLDGIAEYIRWMKEYRPHA